MQTLDTQGLHVLGGSPSISMGSPWLCLSLWLSSAVPHAHPFLLLILVV